MENSTMKIAFGTNILTVSFVDHDDDSDGFATRFAEAFRMLKEGCDNHLTCREADFWAACRKVFLFIEAAGGAVVDADGKWLIIRRRDIWDLPKGKKEKGETTEQNALREVEEETGLGGLKIGHHLCNTFHIYDIYGEWTLKMVSWFQMSTDAHSPATTPQTEEQISEVLWLERPEWLEKLKASFPSLREVAKRIEEIEN